MLGWDSAGYQCHLQSPWFEMFAVDWYARSYWMRHNIRGGKCIRGGNEKDIWRMI